jgi:ParB/RepB/Spo0J family partition protein
MTTSNYNQPIIETKNNNPQIVELSIEQLTVPMSHPRRNSGDMENLQNSIRKNGLLEPLTVSKTEDGNSYMVIDGTRRLTVLVEFGMKTAPCMVLEMMPLGEIAHFSYEKNIERKSLTPIEIALHIKSMQDQYGYSMRELETLGYGSPSMISQKIKLLELSDPVKAMIEKGELTSSHGVVLVKLEKAKYQEKMAKQAHDFGWTAKRLELSIKRFLSKGKSAPTEEIAIPECEIPGVYFKDSRDMSELPDKSVHLIVTSPPYHVGREYEKGISYDEHWENMKEVMNEASRVLVPGGIMAINVADIYHFRGNKGNNDFSQIQLVGHLYQNMLRRHQIYLTDLIIWVKSTNSHTLDMSKIFSDKTPHTGYRFLIKHDPVYIFRKKGERDVPSEEIALKSIITKAEWSQWTSGIWMIDHVRKMEGHPSIYPNELVYRLVKMFSYEGDTVLDPFLGSGTTIKVARELNRNGIGYERLTQYKPVIMKRLGITEKSSTDESTVEYVNKLIAETFVEQAKADVAPEFFRGKGKILEMEPVV